MIFDSHCHLNDEQLIHEVERHIHEANDVGVNYFLIVGWDLTSSYQAVELAKKYEHCYAAIGIHPTDSLKANGEEINALKELVKNPKVVAIGEIGLDYYWNKENEEKEIQKSWFIKQIELANEFDLPIVVHNRDSNQDCLDILKTHRVNKGGVIHCFSGSLEIAKEMVRLGFYLSFGGPVTFKNAKTPKEVVAQMDLSHLLVETDSPYLTPHPYRGTLNSPKYTRLVVEEIARLKHIDVKEVEDVTFQNAIKLFNISL